MEITITRCAPEQLKAKPSDESNLGFGKIFTDHFFVMHYTDGKGWHNAAVEPYRDLCLDPASMCFHYGQEFFEGMKAYRGAEEEIYLFRPEANIKRMNFSAEHLCAAHIDETLFMDGLKQLLLIDQEWVPRSEGTSLYIRPTVIATEKALGVHPSHSYIFFIILCPVGAYYPQGFNPTKMYVTKEYVRAVPGGVGNCKAGGNYAASLYATQEAQRRGYTQVLWLDAVERKYIEEVGTSNIFFVIDGTLLTPPLSGSILPGITRDSVLKLAKRWNIPHEERPISIDEIIAANGNGTLTESFASGTAAIVSPVGHICFEGQEHTIGNGTVGPIAQRLYDEILQIQYGKKEDPFGWRVSLADL